MSNSQEMTAIDVWLLIPEGEEEAEAEANTFHDRRKGFNVEWSLTSVGLVTSVWFATYREARRWLESEGFADYTA